MVSSPPGLVAYAKQRGQLTVQYSSELIEITVYSGKLVGYLIHRVCHVGDDEDILGFIG